MADKDVLELPDEFDRLLRRELSIEPSPAFAARVRQRVGGEVQRSWWSTRWIFAVGSFATVASIAWVLIVPAVTLVTSPPAPPPAPSSSHMSAHRPTLDPWAFTVPATSRVSVRRVAARPVAEGDLPVVIVDRMDRVALDRFVTMVQQGRLGEAAFALTSTPGTVAIEDTLSPIVLAPVAVSSIPAGGVLSSETERK